MGATKDVREKKKNTEKKEGVREGTQTHWGELESGLRKKSIQTNSSCDLKILGKWLRTFQGRFGKPGESGHEKKFSLELETSQF